MKELLKKLAVAGIKAAIRAFGEGVVGAAREEIRQERGEPINGPWTKGAK